MAPTNRLLINRRDLLKWGSAALVGSSGLLRSSLAFAQSRVGPFCPPGEIEQPCQGAGLRRKSKGSQSLALERCQRLNTQARRSHTTQRKSRGDSRAALFESPMCPCLSLGCLRDLFALCVGVEQS